MLGQLISDPDEIESKGSIRGLSLLPIETTMQSSKITVPGTGRLIAGLLFCQPVGNISLHGYEIHVGETSYVGQAQPFAQLLRQTKGLRESVVDGCMSLDSRIFGTYLHGLFDGDGFRHTFINAARAFCHLAPSVELNHWESKRRESLDRLATVVSHSLDMLQIFGWAGLQYQTQSARETIETAL